VPWAVNNFVLIAARFPGKLTALPNCIKEKFWLCPNGNVFEEFRPLNDDGLQE
jgi:hypothetical protein